MLVGTIETSNSIEDSTNVFSIRTRQALARFKAKTLFSVGLMDQICPPSTVFASFNHWSGEKEIKVYPYNGHEGGASYQTLEKLKFLKEVFK